MKTIWQSKVTEDMVGHLSEEELGDLIQDLDDVVTQVCEQYEVN